MFKYYHDPDAQVDFAIYSDEENHEELCKTVKTFYGYFFEEQTLSESKFDLERITFDRDTVIIHPNLFDEEILGFVDEFSIFIVE